MSHVIFLLALFINLSLTPVNTSTVLICIGIAKKDKPNEYLKGIIKLRLSSLCENHNFKINVFI